MKRWLALALVSTAACGSAEQPVRKRAAIYDGTVAREHTAVVAVVNFAGGQCTGSLIAPRLVLTARHCVADTAGKEPQVICGETLFTPPESPGAIFIVPLPEITDDPEDYVAVAEIRMPDDLADDLCGTDVVLLRLKDPLPDVTPLAPRVAMPVEPGEGYSAVGFGVDESVAERPSGVRKRGEGYAVACRGAGCKARDVFDNEWVGNGGPCSGDSGGPAFDAAGFVIGVVSRGKSRCTEPVFSDVATRASWLKAEARAVAQAANEAPPDWACDNEDPCPEPEPREELTSDEPAESCALSRRPQDDMTVWSVTLGAALWLLRRQRNVAPKAAR